MRGRRTIFNSYYKFDSLHRPCKTSNHILRGANQSNEKCDACMDSSWHSSWKVVKDVRKLIAKLIWDSREEALCDVSARRRGDQKVAVDLHLREHHFSQEQEHWSQV
jgi:hypothetical protein